MNHFIFVSRHTWQSFGYAASPHRGSVVYDGIAASPVDRGAARQRLLTQLALPLNARLVGMVGRAPQKDHATLIKAAARVVPACPSVRFLVVGDYSSTAALRGYHRALAQQVEARRLSPYFVFTGFRNDIAELVSGLDVSVLSTHFEGLPLVILEAMAQQTPVIATAVGVFRK